MFENAKISGIMYTILFISFLIGIYMMPYIKAFISVYVANPVLLFLITNIIAFIIAIVLLPKLLRIIYMRISK